MDENYEENYDMMDDTEGAGGENESKADKFRRLAQARTNNAIKQITNIGKLSTSAYEYTPEQVEKIFGALQDALDQAKGKFNKTKSGAQAFTL